MNEIDEHKHYISSRASIYFWFSEQLCQCLVCFKLLPERQEMMEKKEMNNSYKAIQTKTKWKWNEKKNSISHNNTAKWYQTDQKPSDSYDSLFVCIEVMPRISYSQKWSKKKWRRKIWHWKQLILWVVREWEN